MRRPSLLPQKLLDPRDPTVYIGDASICEAAWSGVRVDSLYSYIGTHLLRFGGIPSSPSLPER